MVAARGSDLVRFVWKAEPAPARVWDPMPRPTEIEKKMRAAAVPPGKVCARQVCNATHSISNRLPLDVSFRSVHTAFITPRLLGNIF